VNLEREKKDFNPHQLSGLEQRMTLLQSFLDTGAKQTRRFAAGKLTIVDLTDPFVDPDSACVLFEIITRQFQRAEIGTEKVLVVDEAHKVSEVCTNQHRWPDDTRSVPFRQKRFYQVAEDDDQGDEAYRDTGHHQHAR